MLKKGEQVIIINDPTQAPIKFYHKRTSSSSANSIASTQEGLGYVNNGTYAIARVSGATGVPEADNFTVPTVAGYVTTAGSEINYERMSISGYNANIDALKVVRAHKYVKTDAQIEQAAIQLSGTPATVGTTIGVEIVLHAPNRYIHQFDTVFAEGKIKILRTFKVTSASLADIATQIAQQFNNIGMRQNGENPEMNVVSASGTANSVVTATFRTYLPGIFIDSITITETPVTGSAVMTTAYIPATTALTAALVTVAQNQVGFEGRGVYNNMRMDFPETVNKVYPYAAETAFGKSKPLFGATYTAYLISLKVQSDTHGDYNSAPIEYFDYWIYVNDSCTTVKDSIGSWLNTLNATATNGRKTLLGVGTTPYGVTYAAWTVPPRLVFAAPTLATGAENITTVATTVSTGM